MIPVLFKNREDAAHKLAEKLQAFKSMDCLVLAIPRGGVPLGKIIANELGCDLDLLYTKKIGHPHNKEYAVGAVSLYGLSRNPNAPDVSDAYLVEQAGIIRRKLLEKKKELSGNNESISIENKTVIIVDDGIATGQTIAASINHLKEAGAKQIIIAVPVAPTSAAIFFSEKVNGFICLHTEDHFSSIGAYYEDFSQVSDEEVKNLLNG
jgi:putative phosphoribosyl transferase